MRSSKRDIPITDKQKALLHVAKTKLGLDDDSYKSLLLAYGGVESAKFLNQEGFERVLARLKSLGFETSAPKDQPHRSQYRADHTDPGNLPTPAQLAMIGKLYGELGWDDGKRRIAFNDRMIGKAWPQTRAEANKIIEALKAMVARGYKRG